MVGGTAALVAHRVDVEGHVGCGNAHLLVEAHEHDDHLGIGRRLGGAQAFGADLVEFTQTALLGALGAEHRAGVIELRRRSALLDQIVLHDGTHDACGALGAQRKTRLPLEAGIGARFETAAVVLAAAHDEHLLVHDIGGFPDAAREDLGLFEDRGLNEIVAVGREEPRRDILGMPPVTSCAGKQIDGSFR